MDDTPAQTIRAAQGFHVMTKPVGPICNLDCTYCFYLEKEKLFGDREQFRMPDETLEQYIRQYIESQPVPEITFAWQGGEPTLLGVVFFRRVVELEQKYADGKKIHTAIQTNGTLLDDEWGAFLAENDFLVGLSVDGPRDLHDRYRVDKRGRSSFERVMGGLDVLQKHGAEYNTLTVVHRENAREPKRVYDFLKGIGSQFLQFIPLVERNPTHEAKELGLDLALPPDFEQEETSPVTSWSVDPKDYGEFLVTIYEDWLRGDVGSTFVQLFDTALANWMGMGGTLCVFSEVCGRAMALEHNGDLYSCDHYVYPKYKLGNIMEKTIPEMVDSDFQRKFGTDKRDTLPGYCRRCEVRFACHGECPKHRFMKTPDGEPGLNYLCPAYKRFFNHIDPTMRIMAQLIRTGRPAAEVMRYVEQEDRRTAFASARRNDPCPCGSGKKFKACCGTR